MADPFRLRVLKALTERLAAITPDAGYTNDLSNYEDDEEVVCQRVFRGRAFFGSEPLPMVSVLEHPAALEAIDVPPGGASIEHTSYRLLIQGWVPDDLQNPTDPAHLLAAEVVKCLARERQARFDILGLNGQVKAILIGQPVVRPPEEGVSDAACFYLAVTLTLIEDFEDPFS